MTELLEMLSLLVRDQNDLACAGGGLWGGVGRRCGTV